ncbi:hypothetical protein ACSSS7_002179 [Eimeria intestinalis]
MAGEKARVKWVVNCAGEPTTFTGLSVRVIFLGRELADSDTLASHLRLPARAAAAGPCATSSSAATEPDAPGVTLHAVLSNRPPNARPTAAAGRVPAGGGQEGDWSVVVLGVTRGARGKPGPQCSHREWVHQLQAHSRS